VPITTPNLLTLVPGFFVDALLLAKLGFVAAVTMRRERRHRLWSARQPPKWDLL
jgi:hypothetical protein